MWPFQTLRYDKPDAKSLGGGEIVIGVNRRASRRGGPSHVSRDVTRLDRLRRGNRPVAAYPIPDRNVRRLSDPAQIRPGENHRLVGVGRHRTASTREHPATLPGRDPFVIGPAPRVSAPRQLPARSPFVIGPAPRVSAPRQLPARDPFVIGPAPRVSAPRQLPGRDPFLIGPAPRVSALRQLPGRDPFLIGPAPRV